MNHHSSPQLSEMHRGVLLKVAGRSIEHGLEQGAPLPIAAGDYPAELQALRASFITLMREGNLRGCIGHLEAQMPLVEDVAETAYSAAFHDPRFSPLSSGELEGLVIHISVLTPAEPLTFESEEDLIRKIRPSIDGLILVDGTHRGTFLPSVWESLPDARNFLRHLKQKAGLPCDYWSESLEVHRYQTESFS